LVKNKVFRNGSLVDLLATEIVVGDYISFNLAIY
jgi:hypothetical protein